MVTQSIQIAYAAAAALALFGPAEAPQWASRDRLVFFLPPAAVVLADTSGRTIGECRLPDGWRWLALPPAPCEGQPGLVAVWAERVGARSRRSQAGSQAARTGHVFVFDLARQQLVCRCEQAFAVVWPGRVSLMAWAADGSRLCVASGWMPSASSGLWVIEMAGGQARRIAHDPQRTYFAPAFDPASGRLASVWAPWRQIASPNAPVLAQIEVRDAPDGPPRPIGPRRPWRALRWSPDGRRLAAECFGAGGRELWVIDPETGRARRLVHPLVWPLAPLAFRWGDSKTLWFVAGSSLWRMDLSADVPRREMLVPFRASHYDVRPDGAGLLAAVGDNVAVLLAP